MATATKIKTFEAACKQLKIDPKKLPDVSSLPEHHQLALIAHYKLVIISDALNGGWKPNWSDSSERKYYPWFYVKADDKRPSGFGLSYGGYDVWFSLAIVGFRLCFKSRELAEYAGKTFIKLYEDYYLFK